MLFDEGERRERRAEAFARVLLDTGEGLPPRIAVRGHVSEAVPVAFAGREASVDELDDRHTRFAFLGEQSVEQRACGHLFVRGEKRDGRRAIDSGEHDRAGRVVPGIGLLHDVVAGKSLVGVAGCCHQRSRRRIAATSPMPPTRENSSGANIGGPISAL